MNGTSSIHSKDYAGKIKKKLKKFRNSNFLTDLHLVCHDGTVSMHKILFLQKLPSFAHFLCGSCDHHSETFVILPDSSKSDVQKEVKSLYSYGLGKGSH